MYRLCRSLISSALVIGFMVPQTYSQQTKAESNLVSLAEKEKRFADYLVFLAKKRVRVVNYMRDFAEFQRSNDRDSREYENASSLGGISSLVSEYIKGAWTSLSIYEQLSCEPDRAAASPLIKEQLNDYATQLDSDIKGINISLSYTGNPGIAVSANQLKEDLRQIKEFFNSIDFKVAGKFDNPKNRLCVLGL